MRTVVGARAKDAKAACTNEMARFETETLSTKENLKHLSHVLGRWIYQAQRVRSWTLTTLREKLIKIGAKVVSHAKSIFFQLADVAVPRKLFAAILYRLGRLRWACGSG